MADISKEDLRKEIAVILKDADLASTSSKKVRQELEDKLDIKLQSRKKEIDDLVMEFVSSKTDKKKGKKNDSEDDGGDDDEEEEDEDEEEAESDEDKKKKRGSTAKKPVAKKAKKDSEDESGSEQSEGESEEDSEEYSPKKASKPAKARKLPPKKKKGSESDSDEDWGKKKGGKKGGGGKKGSGYTKPLQLSPELAALVGADSMARHEVVKKLWAIIKEKNLYDPKNKQYTICDDALFKVIGTKRFRTFAMMKYLKSHFIS